MKKLYESNDFLSTITLNHSGSTTLIFRFAKFFNQYIKLPWNQQLCTKYKLHRWFGCLQDSCCWLFRCLTT